MEIQKCKCKKCGNDMPKARRELFGYSDCVNCSNVIPYGHVHILSDKTGDTIQILPGDLAERVNRYAQRSITGKLAVMNKQTES